MKIKGDIDAFLSALFKREAGGVNHKVINEYGYLGKYQFGEAALTDLGYYQGDASAKNDWAGKWTGKNGIISRDDFLNSAANQDTAAKEWVALLCSRMRRYKLDAYIGKIIKGIEITDSGIIAGAHLKGFGSDKHPGVRHFLQSKGEIDPRDGNGTPVSHYVELFAGYDVGCCKQACLAFAEKKTGAPIAGMAVQLKKNGSHLTVAKTDKSGAITTPLMFSPGDVLEVLVAKVMGGFKLLKTIHIQDAHSYLAFLSPKTKAIVKTESHKGAPQTRETAKPTATPPSSSATVATNSVAIANNETTSGSSAQPAWENAAAMGGAAEQSTVANTQPTELANDDGGDAIPDELDILDRALERLSAHQTSDESTSQIAVENPVDKSEEGGAAAKDTTDPNKDVQPESNGQVEQVRNTKGHPLAKIKEQSAPTPKEVTAPMQKIIPGLLFPLPKRPKESYTTGARRFGANRDHGKRKHAGIDLYAPVGTPVRAMTDGEVIRVYEFYAGTNVIEVNHGNFIARYGEVNPKAKFVVKGDRVSRGEKIAEVGRLTGIATSMLHLEMYGTVEDPTASGASLTQRGDAPFQRRPDLIDPTESINQSSMD